MSNAYWEGDVYAVIKAMKATGNQPGVIAQWKRVVEQWAQSRPDNGDARAALAWLPLWQPRPFYRAEELAPIFPALAVAIGVTDIIKSSRSARRLEFELDYGGLPRLLNDRRYFIVERLHYFRDRTLTEKEFENAFD